MTKYDFGYDIVLGSTMEWAFNAIDNNSVVLELGPAIGTLTKHLMEDKACVVDIVEIDEESGNRAKDYARISCLGEVKGNLERDEWKELIGYDKQYDYVVILDVLEHLRNSEQILSYVKELLKEDGKIVLSIPNIAHNSVIVNLLNNKFVYTEVGLLDNTHVRFFTHESLDEMLEKCGLYAYKKEYIQNLVGENEIADSYQDVPEEIAYYLRTRDYGDVYQFLYLIKNKGDEKIERNILPQALPFTLYPLEIYNEDFKLLQVRHVNPEHVSERINLSGVCGKIRLDPIDKKCVIRDLHISFGRQNQDSSVEIVATSGVWVDDKRLVFFDNDPQIFVECKEGDSELYVEYKCVLLSDEETECLWKILQNKIQLDERLVEVGRQVLDLEGTLKKREEVVEQYKEKVELLQKELYEKEEAIKEHREQLTKLLDEMNELKQTVMYRVHLCYKKLRNGFQKK